jgi:hypothetical protein
MPSWHRLCRRKFASLLIGFDKSINSSLVLCTCYLTRWPYWTCTFLPLLLCFLLPSNTNETHRLHSIWCILWTARLRVWWHVGPTIDSLGMPILVDIRHSLLWITTGHTTYHGLWFTYHGLAIGLNHGHPVTVTVTETIIECQTIYSQLCALFMTAIINGLYLFPLASCILDLG